MRWAALLLLLAGCAGPVSVPEVVDQAPSLQPLTIDWTCDAAIVLQIVDRDVATDYLPPGYRPADPGSVLPVLVQSGEAALSVLVLSCDGHHHAVLSVLIEPPIHDVGVPGFYFFAVQHWSNEPLGPWPLDVVRDFEVGVDLDAWYTADQPRDVRVGAAAFRVLDSTGRIQGASTYFSEGQEVRLWSESGGRGLLRGVLDANGSYGAVDCDGATLAAFLPEPCKPGDAVGAVWSALDIEGTMTWDPSGALDLTA